MSLVPDFELGLWNAWILALLMFLIVIGLSSLIIRLFFNNTRNPESFSRHSTTPQFSEREKQLYYISTVILLATLIYSAFLPLKLGTGWFMLGSLFIYWV